MMLSVIAESSAKMGPGCLNLGTGRYHQDWLDYEVVTAA